MKYLDEYRDVKIAHALAAEIRRRSTRPWVLMEICGGQTHTLMRYGIDDLLGDSVQLVHGPGCPVCVTPLEMIDRAIALARRPDVTLVSYGDMLRVPGSETDLFHVKAEGGDVRVVYSPTDAVELARSQPKRHVVFFAIGFETTAPAHAMAVMQAERLVREFHVPIVVGGFEPLDLLEAIRMLVAQLEEGRAAVENQYSRSVQYEGNRPAQEAVARVFEVSDRKWRGIGPIPESGLRLKEKYAAFDAERLFDLADVCAEEPSECISAEVLLGLKKPTDCSAFGTRCTPEKPLGAPMVSSEGACAAYYQYRRHLVTL